MATTQNKPPASSETLKPDYASLSKDIAWIQRIGSAIAGGFAAVFIGLITWYLPREFENSRQILKGTVTEQLNPITQDIAALKGQVASISGIIPQLMKEKLQAHGSSVKESLQTVAEIAKSARAKKIETDPKAIGEIGVKVLEIGERNPQMAPTAWQAPSELLDYQSFLKAKTLPDISNAKPITQSPVPYGFEFTGRPIPKCPGYSYPAIPVNMHVEYVEPFVSLASSALLEPLGRKLNERPAQTAPTYLIVESRGFEFSLDGYRMRNVIFKGGSVMYNGGPAAIQNVYLVDCTFNFKPNADWKRLSEALFAQASLSFFKGATSP